jgi:hypothetical protein
MDLLLLVVETVKQVQFYVNIARNYQNLRDLINGNEKSINNFETKSYF